MPKNRLACVAALTIVVGSAAWPVEVRAEALSLDASLVTILVTAHNDLRQRASPTPEPPLEALVWSEEAATVARAWAERCTFVHNPERGAFGENLFATTTVRDPRLAVEQAMKSWSAEAKDFDLQKNSCTAGKVCGHYTQLVWRATRSVGCAMAACTTGSPLPAAAWTLLVCDYAPPGNMAGEKPY